MFSKFRKYMVLAVVSVASLAIVGQAAATTVTVSPGGAVTGTGTASQLSLNTARRTINCTTSTATATLAGGSTVISTNLVPAFSTCTLTGGLRPTVACGSSTLTVTSTTVGGITNGTISGISCTISLSGTCSVRVTGSVTGSYDNARAELTVNSPGGQSLAASGSTCTTLPNDTSATFGASGGGNLVYRISPAQTVTVV